MSVKLMDSVIVSAKMNFLIHVYTEHKSDYSHIMFLELCHVHSVRNVQFHSRVFIKFQGLIK
jgi:hypothetical protein